MNPEKFHNRKSKAILKAIAGAILLWYFGMGLNQIVISYYEGIRGSQAVPKAMAAMEREFVEVEFVEVVLLLFLPSLKFQKPLLINTWPSSLVQSMFGTHLSQNLLFANGVNYPNPQGMQPLVSLTL